MLLTCPFVTQDGDSALTRAASGGNTNVVVELVKAGTKLDLQNKVLNSISRLLPHERLDLNIPYLIIATQTLNRLEILLPQCLILIACSMVSLYFITHVLFYHIGW